MAQRTPSPPSTSVRKPLEWSAAELEGRAARLEWLETDGLGGFACGTVAGTRTRRYHGWYVPAIPPPRRRWMFVSGGDEFVDAGGETVGISMQAYRDAEHPAGARTLSRFRLEPFPTWRYEGASFAVERSLCLVRERSLAIVRWVNRGASEIRLRVRPLLAFRGSHRLQTETTDWDPAIEVRGEISWVRPVPYLPRLYLRGVFAATQTRPVWYRHFRYAEEAERGYDAEEDLWSPLEWEWVLRPDARAFALFSLDEVAADPEHFLDEERRRRQAFARTGDPVFDEMSRRAECFLAEADHRRATVLAGFPWLADWGRQTMVAAPGLAQATGRAGALARVLNTFAAGRRDGLIPSHFSREEGEPEYDSIDASLWFVLAVDWFGRARRAPRTPSPLLGAVRSVIEAYRRGTRFGTGVGPDGLLVGNAPGHALTWMDAAVDGKPVTPRSGRAVEVNALWHAALKCAARLERLSEEAGRARELESEAWHVARRFNETFWYGAKGYLYDVVGDGGPDASLRPNQIFAVSLTEDLLPPHRARSVYWTVRRSLLTPFGLRTLDAEDPRYRGRCTGDEARRAESTHQGTVWPWLMGPFADAHLRVFGNTDESRRTLRALLAPLRAHVRDAGLGFISECFDGDPPHAPRGCFAQAWSVAEIARVVYTHLLGED
ncbi:MAG TPA: amylo-alpha-1,6-glucosidase [Thermoanaerobaculia bacterium]|nr:amylo-alpha-1,6-glucosidase [Thermoanaerobaculia bacterium]